MALKGPVSPRDPKPKPGPWTPVKYTFAGKPVKVGGWRKPRQKGKRSRKHKRKHKMPVPESVVDQLALLAIGEK